MKSLLSIIVFIFILQASKAWALLEHDISGTCISSEILWAVDDGQKNEKAFQKTYIYYKKLNDLDKDFEKIALPVNIKDPEGLACQGYDFFITSGEFDKKSSKNFLLLHLKLYQKKGKMVFDMIKAVNPLDLINAPLISLFGLKGLEQILESPAKNGGLNIEGLGFDGKTLTLGLRSPTYNKQAVLLNLNPNFEASAINIELLNLEGKGIRGLDTQINSDGHQSRLIIAGPTGKEGNYSLVRNEIINSQNLFYTYPIVGLCRPEGITVYDSNKAIIQSEFSGGACEGFSTDYEILDFND